MTLTGLERVVEMEPKEVRAPPGGGGSGNTSRGWGEWGISRWWGKWEHLPGVEEVGAPPTEVSAKF